MKIALIAPPFIAVPPADYGGTELFVAHLAEGLQELGRDVVVYANGESTVPVACRSLYPDSEWPIKGDVHGSVEADFYNFVRNHRTIRCTPAMEAGVVNSALSIGDLVDMAA